MKKNLLFLLVGIVCFGCNTAAQTEKTIRGNYAEMDRSLSAKNIDAAMSYFAPDMVNLDPQNKPVSLDKAKAGMQAIFNASQTISVTTTLSSVAVSGSGVTVNSATRITANNARGVLESNSTSRDYWEQIGGAWKIKRSRTFTQSASINGVPLPQ